jgi:ribosomal protein S18
MKTYHPHQVTRHHGIFRVDEYIQYDKDPDLVKQFIEEETKLFEKESNQWKDMT